MSDIKPIIEAYRKSSILNVRMALATVVRVQGSAYRTPGARMLILNDGTWYGSVSGGCLEGDVLRKARMVMETRVPQVVRYDTVDEDNSPFSINLGCNGIIHILLEAVHQDDLNNPISLLEDLVKKKSNSIAITIVNGPPAWIGKKICYSDSNFDNHLPDLEHLTNELESICEDTLVSRTSVFKTWEYQGIFIDLFIEFISPPLKLALFGAGYDARPLSQLAHDLGWTVSVTDECVAHVAPVFFPSADALSMCHRELVDSKIDVDDRTACVLISHNYDYDLAVLIKLLASPTSYIGIVGPRRRFDRMVNDLSQRNIILSPADLERIHAPIGLDIGAETPTEIAIAILGEIMAKFYSRNGSFLKERDVPIHDRTADNEVLKAAM